MNVNFYLTVTIMLAIYCTANYYIGWRGWEVLKLNTSQIRGKSYILVISILALVYPLARLGEAYSSAFIDNLTLAGALWLGILYYLCLFALSIDLLGFINKRWKFLPLIVTHHPVTITTLVFCTTLVLVSYGAWNARHPVTQHYDVTISKTAGSFESIQVVMVSDLHLGNIINNHRLTKFINRINQLEPDIVLLAGDMIDGKVDTLLNQNMVDNFARLKPPLGTYAILGNHEYFDRQPDKAIQYLEQGNVHVLRDQWALIADSFYLVGRDDLSKQRYTGNPRQDLASIMAGIDHTLPIILLDHQPQNLQDGVEQGADLQLSGHTHLGQMFPNNLITKQLFDLDWGYLRKESLQVIVSCGIGTWGPPIRLGSQPEFVTITIHFIKAPSSI